MSAYVIIDHDNQTVSSGSLSAITAAKQLTENIQAIVLGYQCQSVVNQLVKIAGIQQVLVADNIIYQNPIAENYVNFINHNFSDCDYLLVAANSFGKNLLPRVAAKWQVPQISDVIEILNSETFRHPIHAGNVIETLRVQSKPVCLTIRGTAFGKPAVDENNHAAVKQMQAGAADKRIQFLGLEKQHGRQTSLPDADIVLAGGRGLKNRENFLRMIAIADKLGAAVGASRAAVDAGLAPNEWQVGQTGQTVAPSLYFALGISGAVQHLAGMKDSATIVAINKDPDAPIFQIADYGLVADLEDVLTEWEQRLDN